MPGLFDLVSYQDLCAKLDHDYRRIKASPSDAFATLDFILTAWHLLEWKYANDEGKQARQTLCEEHPILGLCEHLCVSGKHYAPTNPKLRSLQESFRGSAWKRGVWAPGLWAKGVWRDELLIDLSGPAKDSFGERVSMEKFADLMMEFWRGPGGCPKERRVAGTAM